MNTLPQMTSITDLKNRHLEVFAKLGMGPVVIAQRNQPAGVLVSPAQWDTIAERLEDMADMIAALNAELEIEHGKAEWIDTDISKLEAMAAGDAIHA